ncbi:MAG: endopeptidase La [Myxococcales bacterium]|nr:endopeptidase La [Myxococcales bacterium]
MAFFKNDDEDSEQPGNPAEPNSGWVPLLPLRDIVVFPQMVVPLFVGRDRSVKALEEAMGRDQRLMLAAQCDASTDDPEVGDIHEIGTLGTIVQLIKLPDGTVKVLVEGKSRARVTAYDPNEEEYFLVALESIEESEDEGPEAVALMRGVKAAFKKYVQLNKKVPPEMLTSVTSLTSASALADTVAAHLNLKVEDKQRLLEILSPRERLEEILGLMQAELDVLQVENRIRSRVKKQMERSQKEYYLNEQMRAIQKELGERDEFKSEIDELTDKLATLKISPEGEERCQKEIKKLKAMTPTSAEATVVRNYVDWILSLPWGEDSEENKDINAAEEVLDSDHYGLEKPKERILEYLAVRALVEEMKGPILCFVGPPGVGKTSLGRSIASATERDFVRISLGGVRDEAEIRGHRRTYIGAMPGKIIQGLKKAGSGNPVFLLDEIDKLSMDFRGDPSSALLEVLDPEQNHTFNDHYLDLDYDLSRILFITTANTLQGIPRPLQDRMEIIHLPGYIEEEKLEIAKRFLIPKQLKTHGLSDEVLGLNDSALLQMIRVYTKEAGVRGLERELGTICRKVAREVVANEEPIRVRIAPRSLRKYLGIPRHRYGMREDSDQVGVCTGLAFTEVGGELLNIEALVTSGKGKVKISGRLGETMQESAHAAVSYVRRRARQLGLARDFYQKVDIHVHIPEGGVPKDGPSVGITMATALTSALTGIPVKANIAMTGEVTLRGRVLPIGGLKEKLIAAVRGGVDTVLIPKENERELQEVSAKVTRRLQIVFVESMDEVLQQALRLADPAVLSDPMEYPLEEIFQGSVEAPGTVN